MVSRIVLLFFLLFAWEMVLLQQNFDIRFKKKVFRIMVGIGTHSLDGAEMLLTVKSH